MAAIDAAAAHSADPTMSTSFPIHVAPYRQRGRVTRYRARIVVPDADRNPVPKAIYLPIELTAEQARSEALQRMHEAWTAPPPPKPERKPPTLLELLQAQVETWAQGGQRRPRTLETDRRAVDLLAAWPEVAPAVALADPLGLLPGTIPAPRLRGHLLDVLARLDAPAPAAAGVSQH